MCSKAEVKVLRFVYNTVAFIVKHLLQPLAGGAFGDLQLPEDVSQSSQLAGARKGYRLMFSGHEGDRKWETTREAAHTHLLHL